LSNFFFVSITPFLMQCKLSYEKQSKGFRLRQRFLITERITQVRL